VHFNNILEYMNLSLAAHMIVAKGHFFCLSRHRHLPNLLMLRRECEKHGSETGLGVVALYGSEVVEVEWSSRAFWRCQATGQSKVAPATLAARAFTRSFRARFYIPILYFHIFAQRYSRCIAFSAILSPLVIHQRIFSFYP
jgi:hypothetical protein